jgi:hypothetical protein
MSFARHALIYLFPYNVLVMLETHHLVANTANLVFPEIVFPSKGALTTSPRPNFDNFTILLVRLWTAIPTR